MTQPNTCPLITICDPEAYMDTVKADLTDALVECDEADITPEYNERAILEAKALGAAVFMARNAQSPFSPAIKHICPFGLTSGGTI